jgi:hypothetical protein
MSGENNKKVSVPFPILMDQFRDGLIEALKGMQGETLSPALVKDVQLAVSAILQCQQLMVGMYNLNVTNYEVLMQRVVDLEGKVKEKMDKKELTELITKELQNNSALRIAIKSLI